MKNLLEMDELLDSVMPNQINLKSFESKKDLNDKIWYNGELKEKVRKQLLKIANEFIDTLKIDNAMPKDIVLVGSIAGYNWSKYSDIDLHVMYDFSEIDENTELVTNYLKAKKKQWNSKHENININGFEVELYAQDIHETNHSEGIYSVLKDKWIKMPQSKMNNLNKKMIKKLAAEYINKIEYLENKYKHCNNEQCLLRLKAKTEELYKQIIEGRRNSLAEYGESAVENIVFKVLRRSKHLERLINLKTKVFDKLNSLNDE